MPAVIKAIKWLIIAHAQAYVSEEGRAQNKNKRMSKWTNKQTNRWTNTIHSSRSTKQCVRVQTKLSKIVLCIFQAYVCVCVMKSIDIFERACELKATWTKWNGVQLVLIAIVLVLPLMSLSPHQLLTTYLKRTNTNARCTMVVKVWAIVRYPFLRCYWLLMWL